MTDIVERLRDHLSVIDTYPKETRSDDMAGFIQTVRVAADEIERLRALSVEVLSGGPTVEIFEAVVAERDRLFDEIERLRAQLAANERDLAKALAALDHHLRVDR